MRYISIIKASPESEAGLPPDPRLLEAMGNLLQEAMAKGQILQTEGLAPSALGVRIHAANGSLTIVDGPFAETKELVGGFAILETETREEAIEAARQVMQVHIDVLGDAYEGQCELRPIGFCGGKSG